MKKLSDVEKVAKILKVNPETVRRGLEQGRYPFGTAVKCDKRYSYQFYPVKVKEFLGVDLDEERN